MQGIDIKHKIQICPMRNKIVQNKNSCIKMNTKLGQRGEEGTDRNGSKEN